MNLVHLLLGNARRMPDRPALAVGERAVASYFDLARRVLSLSAGMNSKFNLKPGDLKAKRRTKNIALPRQLAMYLCRKHTSTSFPSIGDKFGGRDHSTVIHAAKTIEKKIKADPQMSATLEKLEKNISARK